MSGTALSGAAARLPVAVVPGVLALLPEYASLDDPVAALRAACATAVARLGPRVQVIGSEQGTRVGTALVTLAGGEVTAERDEASGVLVVGNGSATRTEKAPGHFDDRAEEFDTALAEGLRGGAVRGEWVLAEELLAEELWADVAAFAVLEELVGERTPEVVYEDAPFGVAYWVMVW